MRVSSHGVPPARILEYGFPIAMGNLSRFPTASKTENGK
jgi:hypothetical protein